MEKMDAATMQQAFEAALRAQADRRKQAAKGLGMWVAKAAVVLAFVAVCLVFLGFMNQCGEAAGERQLDRLKAGIGRPVNR